ncbi:T9SS type B sorting domain-containing protein [Chryseobacterium sp.]|uniref:T9SS type B sorting domain-containing protein n=1 Tax=Chryseobacterium sp. TaxID=1871047 RepID=UPI00289D446A|nr:T9SS type B sorting domain-containing protein [Chryseobacterium sp.]
MKRILQVLTFFMTFYAYSQNSLGVTIKDAAGNENYHVSCTNDLNANGCITLQTEYPVIKQTNTYQLTQATYSPAIPINQGTSLNANFDDAFTPVINLPFNFCFFNQSFNALVIGSNGMITFDATQAGKINFPNVNWQNPNTSLPKNSIFGVYHDMVFSASDQSEIYYSTIGTAPNRKFIVNFYEGRIAGCTERSSSQIVLHETTNIIEVFVDKKLTPCATRKFENALIGIIDNSGTVGYSPASRNTGNWQALQEAWKFTPSGSNVTPEVIWKNTAGQTVATGIEATLCPTQNETYTTEVNFNTCGSTILTLTDTFDLTFDAAYPTALNYSQTFCGNNTVNLNLDSFKPNLTSQNPANFNFTYHNTLADAQNNANPLSSSYPLNGNKVIYVRIQNPTTSTCFRVATLTLTFLTKELLTSTVSLCDTNNDGVENDYELSLLNNSLLAPGNTSIVYFLSQSNAQNNTNPVTVANISAGTQVWLRVQDPNCTYVLGPVTFSLRPGVNAHGINYPLTICDINDDNNEPYEFALHMGPLISSQPGASFVPYSTFAAAFEGQGTILQTIKEGVYPIFIRVSIPGGCFTVVQVNMNVTFTKIKANHKNEYICFNGTQDITVNLNTLSANLLIDPLTVPVTEYYATSDDAFYANNPISPAQTITTDGNFVSQTFYVRFEQSDDCFTVRPITVHLVHPVIVNNNFTVCDFNNDNSESVNLTQFSASIIGNQNASTTFFLSQANAQSGTNPVTTVTLTGNQQYFVKINSFNCEQIYPFTVGLVSTPSVNANVNITLNNICDNNNDGVENYNLTLAQAQIYSGSSPVTFTYYQNYNPSNQTFWNEISNPSSYPVTGNATVYVKIKFNSNECFSASKVTIQMNFLPVVVVTNNAVLNTCDEDFNLSETFTLTDAISQMYDPAQNTYALSNIDVKFYHSQAEANAGNPANQIGNTLVTDISSVQVWARFTAKTTGCFSVAPLQLNTYFPPKSINSTIIICDGNLDGNYEVNLMNYTNQYVDLPNPMNTFSFYLTLQDAQNAVNEIQNPTLFSVNPFPAQIWVRVMNIPGCDDIATITFQFGDKVITQPGPYLLNDVCDQMNDGIENVNLTQFQNQIYSGSNATFVYYPSLTSLQANSNVIANPASYGYNQNTGPSTIFVKVEVTGLCPEYTTIAINLKEVPMFSIPTQFFCPDGTFSYTLQVEKYNIISYTWTDPTGNVVSTTDTVTNMTLPGNYTVTVTAENGCSYTAIMEAKYFDVPKIEQLVPNGNIFTVIASGSQPILYSIDGTTWQNSNVFYNLPTGITKFYVKYTEGSCIITKEGLVLDIKNAITPNGDGFNDTWVIKDLHVFDGKMTNVKIYDRYQVKIFEQETNSKIIWDGTIAGRPIPTSSYWYIIVVPDGRVFNGWVLVKNNN